MTVERKMSVRTRRAEPAETYEEPDLVRYYLREVGNTPLLTAEDEVDLSKRIEAGVYAAELLRRAAAGEAEFPASYRRELAAVAADGGRAKDHMVRANLRLVVSVAKKYAHRGMPLLDVIQEGNLGLIRAVEKFDYAKGYKFSTYAMWWIRQAIDRGLAMQGRTIRLPVHVAEELAKLARLSRQLRDQLDRDPTDAELAEAAGLREEHVTEVRRAGRDTVSLDMPVGDEGDTSIGDLIEDTDVAQATDVLESEALAVELRTVVNTLPEREARIVTMRFGLHGGEPATLQEVAEAIGLTRERVRQLEKQAIAQLRDPNRNRSLQLWAA